MKTRRSRSLRTRLTLYFVLSSVPAVAVSAGGAVVLHLLIGGEIWRRNEDGTRSINVLVNAVRERVRASVTTFAESEELKRNVLEPLEQGESPEPETLETLLDKAASASGLELLALVEMRNEEPVILASVHSPASIEKRAPLFVERSTITTTVGFAHELIAGNPPAWVPAIIGVCTVVDAKHHPRLVVYGGVRLDGERIESIAVGSRARVVIDSPNLGQVPFPRGVETRGFEDDPAIRILSLPGGRAKPFWATLNAKERVEPSRETRVHIRVNTTRLQEARATFATFAAVLAAGSVFVALFGGALISRSITGPILDLADAAQKVGAGDLDIRLSPRRQDEVGGLVTVFNQMTGELAESRVRLARAERIAAWREIARRVAHEIKNPLFPIQMSMETLRKSYKSKHQALDEIVEESTRTVLEEVRSLNRIVTEFSEFARLPAPKTEPIEALELLSHVHDLYAHSAPYSVVFDRTHLAERKLPRLFVDREQIGRALINLVKNACEAIGDQPGTITLDAQKETRGGKDGVTLSISDTGSGMPEEVREQIFTPYFTTKSAGTGLGLAIVDRVVQEHQGVIDVESALGRGTTFRIWLPIEQSPERATSRPSRPLP